MPGELGTLLTEREVVALRQAACGQRYLAETHHTAARTARSRLGVECTPHAVVTALRLGFLPLYGSVGAGLRHSLPRRRREYVTAAAWCRTTQDIADLMGVTLYTTKTTLGLAAKDMGTAYLNRAALVVAALQFRQITLADIPWPEWLTQPQATDTPIGAHCEQWFARRYPGTSMEGFFPWHH